MNCPDTSDSPGTAAAAAGEVKKKKRNKKLTPREKTLFIKALRELGSVIEACAVTGVKRATVYYAKNHDPSFGKRWDEALKDTYGEMLSEAVMNEMILNAAMKNATLMNATANSKNQSPVMNTIMMNTAPVK